MSEAFYVMMGQQVPLTCWWYPVTKKNFYVMMEQQVPLTCWWYPVTKKLCGVITQATTILFSTP
jgi:hypothetical protein